MFNSQNISAVLLFGLHGVLLFAALDATAAEERYIPPLTANPLPEVTQKSMWEGFAQDVGLTSEELADYRANLPEAGIDDLMWTEFSRGFNELLLELHRPLTADDLLLAKPDVQVLIKVMADIQYGSVTVPHPATAFDDALWDHFAAELADFVPLRDTDQEFTAADALWVHVARQHDAATLQQRPVTAYELLEMPDYQLRRKLIVDDIVTSMLDCAACAIDTVSPTTAACKDECEKGY